MPYESHRDPDPQIKLASVNRRRTHNMTMKNSKNNKTRSFEERNKLANAELRIATIMCLENNYGFGSVTAEQLYDLSGLTAGDWDAFTGMGYG